jgi:lipopolysaccharide export system permease protein
MYDLMPIAALIGTIYALAQFASRSEFTTMRVAGLSTMKTAWILSKIALILVLLTFVIGEFIAPMSSRLAQSVKSNAQGVSYTLGFRTGLWAKDVIRNEQKQVIGTRFVNAKEFSFEGKLNQVKMYELDDNFKLNTFFEAKNAEFLGDGQWNLSEVYKSSYKEEQNNNPSVLVEEIKSKKIISDLTPDILAVSFLDPNKMSIVDLIKYTQHLFLNKEKSARYEISLWRKIVYPFAIFVMMALALPFAYLHARSGGVSFKIFIGIMLGVSFLLSNNLFSHLGLLNTWPAPITVMLPSLLFMSIALIILARIQRY